MLSIILLILSAPALFVPVFSGYVLGLLMIVLAISLWSSKEFQKVGSNGKAFIKALMPVSRAAAVFWLCLAFSACAAGTLSGSIDQNALIRSLGNFFVKYVLLWFVYLSFWWRVGASDQNSRIFSTAYALSAVVNAAYCLIQRQIGVDWAHGFGHFLGENRFAYGVYRVSGFMGHPLTLGYCQVLALVASIHFFMVSISRQEKIAWLASALSAAFVLLISGSRGPQLTALVGGLLIVPIRLWKLRWREVGVMSLLLLILAAKIGVFERYSELLSRGFGGDMRSIHWAVHWQVFKDNFWFGMGPGGPKSAISAYYFAYQADDNIRLAHNTFLQCGADFGIVGLGGMFLWLRSWSKIEIRSKATKQAISVVIAVTVLAGLTQNVLQDSGFVLGVTTWIMIITSFEVSRRDKLVSTTQNSNHFSREGDAAT